MNSILGAIIAHLTYAIGDSISVFANRKLGYKKVVFWSWLGSIPIMILGIPFFIHNAGSVTLISLAETIVLSLILVISFFAFNASLEKSNAILAGTISGAFPALVVILALWWFRETLNAQQIIALIIIFMGMLIASIPASAIFARQLRLERGLWYAFAAFLGWGIYFTFIRLPIEIQGWFLTNSLVVIVGFFIILLIFILRNMSPGHPSFKWQDGYVPAMFATALTTIGTYAFSYAIEYGQSSIVAPIVGAYPALYALLAYFLYRDRLERSQVAGIIITLGGVIILSICFI